MQPPDSCLSSEIIIVEIPLPKAQLPIVLTLAGIEISVRLEHP